MRKKWLLNQESLIYSDCELFHKRIEILEREADILRSDHTLDQYLVEGFYESLELRKLIALTKQRSEAGDGFHDIIRSGADELPRILQNSIYNRQIIASGLKNIEGELDKIVIANRQREVDDASNLMNSTSELIAELTDSGGKSRENLNIVTNQYLIIRHNARIATSILADNMSDYEIRSFDLEEGFLTDLKEVEFQIYVEEERGRREVDIQLHSLRSRVMALEAKLEASWSGKRALWMNSQGEISRMRALLRNYNLKYGILQRARLEGMTGLQADLQFLRDEIMNVEGSIGQTHLYVERCSMKCEKCAFAHEHSAAVKKCDLKEVEKYSEYGNEVDILGRIRQRLTGLKQHLDDFDHIYSESTR